MLCSAPVVLKLAACGLERVPNYGVQVRDVNNIESSVKQSLKDLNLENFDLLLLPVQGMDKSALTVSQPAVQLPNAASKSDLTAGQPAMVVCGAWTQPTHLQLPAGAA